jgi:hypothetical protein
MLNPQAADAHFFVLIKKIPSGFVKRTALVTLSSNGLFPEGG